ncbi:hypothetical protein AYO38_01545 [bacterium SCGC AG-212-C10]|nr:hypothetical protein AYO38_01545 [bacterium SCGC AG-212-C10]
MKDAPFGIWEPYGTAAATDLMQGFRGNWWIAGGHAIEAFAGRVIREHDDIDIGILREDAEALHAHLRTWDLQAADPPGTLRRWGGEPLGESVHDVWARESPTGPWRVQFMLNESEQDEWIFRREPMLRLPLMSLTFEQGGAEYLIPEVQLLFKAKGLREKDQTDFEAALPLLEPSSKAWLSVALKMTHPGHPWIDRLGV